MALNPDKELPDLPKLKGVWALPSSRICSRHSPPAHWLRSVSAQREVLLTLLQVSCLTWTGP